MHPQSNEEQSLILSHFCFFSFHSLLQLPYHNLLHRHNKKGKKWKESKTNKLKFSRGKCILTIQIFLCILFFSFSLISLSIVCHFPSSPSLSLSCCRRGKFPLALLFLLLQNEHFCDSFFFSSMLSVSLSYFIFIYFFNFFFFRWRERGEIIQIRCSVWHDMSYLK